MSKKPWWKGDFVHRDLLKNMLEEGYQKMALEDDFDVALGNLTSNIEHYVATQVMTNTKEALKMVFDDMKSALETVEEMEKQLLRDRIKTQADGD